MTVSQMKLIHKAVNEKKLVVVSFDRNSHINGRLHSDRDYMTGFSTDWNNAAKSPEMHCP